MMSPQERLEHLLKVLEELEALSEEMPVIVEGMRDIEALRRLGIEKNVLSLSKGMSIFSFCESLAREWDAVVILTDWDRKGGRLASKLREALMANSAKPIETVRTQLALLGKKEIKDIESLPTYIRRLRTLAGVH